MPNFKIIQPVVLILKQSDNYYLNYSLPTSILANAFTLNSNETLIFESNLFQNSLVISNYQNQQQVKQLAVSNSAITYLLNSNLVQSFYLKLVSEDPIGQQTSLSEIEVVLLFGQQS